MSRWLKQCVRGLWVVAALCAMQVYAAVQITDDHGEVVRFDQSPQRIVSLLPSLSETVCALGQCQRLVGVDRYTNWPEDLKLLPRVGGGLDPNIEHIVSLRPDVVLIATSARVSERLRALGIKVIAMEPRTRADVQTVFLRLGHLLEVPHAQNLWQDMSAEVAHIAQSMPPQVRGTRVYFEVSAELYAAGEASFIGEMLTQLDVKNIVPASLGAFPRLNPEYIVRANPDLIMVSQRSIDGMAQRPGWGQLRALRERRVCVFSAQETDILVRPGPRMVEGSRIMARCLAKHAPGLTKSGAAS